MYRFLIVGLLVAGCTQAEAQNDEAQVLSSSATEAVWADSKAEICPLIREALAYGVLTEEQILDLVIGEVARSGDVDPAVLAEARRLIERDC